MVNHVVTGVPQAEGRERIQKRIAANPFVQFAMRCEALVASIMTNDEQTANDKTCSQAAEQFEPHRRQNHSTSHQA